MTKHVLIYLFSALLQSINAQGLDSGFSSILFWTAQDWPCEFQEIEVFSGDTVLKGKGKLKDTFSENRVPLCTDSKVLIIENLSPGFYFFVAECYKEECYVCNGEGSYWQAIMQDRSSKQTGIKSKGNIDGTWRTCTVCNGDGASSSTVWMDTLTLKGQQCRSILLK